MLSELDDSAPSFYARFDLALDSGVAVVDQLYRALDAIDCAIDHLEVLRGQDQLACHVVVRVSPRVLVAVDDAIRNLRGVSLGQAPGQCLSCRARMLVVEA